MFYIKCLTEKYMYCKYMYNVRVSCLCDMWSYFFTFALYCKCGTLCDLVYVLNVRTLFLKLLEHLIIMLPYCVQCIGSNTKCREENTMCYRFLRLYSATSMKILSVTDHQSITQWRLLPVIYCFSNITWFSFVYSVLL